MPTSSRRKNLEDFDFVDEIESRERLEMWLNTGIGSPERCRNGWRRAATGQISEPEASRWISVATPNGSVFDKGRETVTELCRISNLTYCEDKPNGRNKEDSTDPR